MKIRRIAFIGVFAALTAVLAQISFPIPFANVPFTLAIAGVMLTGAILPPVDAFFALLAYLLVGLAGVPVYSQFTAGPGILFGITGGYIFGYAAMAPIIAFAAKRFQKHLYPALIVGMIVGLAVCYIIGTAWYMLLTGADLVVALSGCVIPFIIPDLIKAVLMASLAIALRKALSKANLYTFA